MTELLRSTKLSEEQAEYADTIFNSAQSLVAVIDEILDFSELETGRLRLRPSEMDVAGILDDIGATIRARAVKKQVAVEVLRSDSLPRHCIGEDKRIRQALMQLCDNAVKFTETGFIRISAKYTAKSPSRVRSLFPLRIPESALLKRTFNLSFSPLLNSTVR